MEKHRTMTMEHSTKGHDNHYKKLLLMAVLSFFSMYALMYSMVDIFPNAIPNVNQFYMAGLMTCPMIIIELCLMGAMFMNKKLNAILIVGSGILLIVFFLFIRQQRAVGDKQFLKSMIPHHAAAILMAKNVSIQDPEIQELCRTIILTQQAEIDQMKAKLKELKK